MRENGCSNEQCQNGVTKNAVNISRALLKNQWRRAEHDTGTCTRQDGVAL